MGIIKKNYYAILVANALNDGLTYDPDLVDNILERLGFCLPITIAMDNTLYWTDECMYFMEKRCFRVRQCNNKQ